MALTTIIGQAISQVGMSAFARMTDDKKQEEALLKVVERMSVIAAPIYGLFYLCVNKQTIALIFGVNWIPVCTVIPGLLIFAYFRLINTSISSMLSAKGRPDINAKVNLQIAPLAILSFILAAKSFGIIGVSVAVAVVLGIVWTFYWWWIGCRELGWSFLKFLIYPVKFAFFVLTDILICLKFNYFFQSFLFVLIYLLSIRVFANDIFYSYKLGLIKIFKK
jgi:O-antigen/teichoic acid export membrane protein